MASENAYLKRGGGREGRPEGKKGHGRDRGREGGEVGREGGREGGRNEGRKKGEGIEERQDRERGEEAILLSIFTSDSSPWEDVVQVLVPQRPSWSGPQWWLHMGSRKGTQCCLCGK